MVAKKEIAKIVLVLIVHVPIATVKLALKYEILESVLVILY